MTGIIETNGKKEISFDSSDWKGMMKLMERADEFDQPWVGENSEGERVLISVNHNNITTQTFQSNGWARENVYWNDFTIEELFHKC